MNSKKDISSAYRHLKISAGRWWKHRHADTAASLAFYSLISLVPILITGLSVASWLVGEETAKRSLLDGADSIAGKTVKDYFTQLLNYDINWVGSGISPLIGGAFLLYSATKVIAELRKCLGSIFGKPRHRGRRAAMANAAGRMIAMVLLLFLGGFIACAVVVETIVTLILHSLEDSPVLLKIATYSAPLLTFVAMVLLAATTMRWLPPRPPKFREAIHGGIVSAVLLLILKLALTIFLTYADVGNFYGSALTLVLVLFWIYFAMQAFLFGAEYTSVLTHERRVREELEERETSTGLENTDSASNSVSPETATTNIDHEA